ncbi:GntR family transcriptional regulator [Compostimonas suwonensis]|uniref:DNA-binding transcriptional regulator YhcF (GntR family) n=1 Tax=Compostimonas suwonensis TaxID=1048394 RepID=A0A2M9C3T5_9MICO|nr:GntR family transcriptional regulator [Compostimonas suwonensis]PJJ65191.1 DNA-binding transcriptional regulator YhcF (GntR family) [Compostimonas suwonensis]
MMSFRIDPESPVPPYEQLRIQIRDAARNGTLVAGAKLPTVRGLAEQLGLAANTVARSYRALEHDEVIETRGRLGSFVAAQGDPVQRQGQLAASAFAERAVELGLTADEALALVRAALAAKH